MSKIGNVTLGVLALCGWMLLGSSATVQAQTVVNPTRVVFVASVDHNSMLNGTPVLDHYDLNLITGTTNVIAFTQGLAKPTPDATNTITVSLSTSFLNAMIKNAVYSAIVNSVGTGGSTPSAPSNPFATSGPPAAATAVRIQ